MAYECINATHIYSYIGGRRLKSAGAAALRLDYKIGHPVDLPQSETAEGMSFKRVLKGDGNIGGTTLILDP